MELPDTLKHKIELFRERGRVFRYNDELFDTPSWIAVLLGQGIIPEEYDPLVDGMPDAHVQRAMAVLRTGYQHAAMKLPLASDFISSKVSEAA